MAKWVIGLCIALYGVLILFGGEGYDASKYAEEAPVETALETTEVAVADTEATVDVTRTSVSQTTQVIEPVTQPTGALVAVSTSEPTTVTNTNGALIEPVATASLDTTATSQDSETRPTLVLQSAAADETTEAVTTALSDITPEPAIETSTGPVGEIWLVTGNRVNLRAGASTSNPILGRTVRGDSAEIIEMLDNGWAKVYILESGLEAYMSADFLSPNRG